MIHCCSFEDHGKKDALLYFDGSLNLSPLNSLLYKTHFREIQHIGLVAIYCFDGPKMYGLLISKFFTGVG